jgi:hypothetical protein
MPLIHTSIPHYKDDQLNSLCGLIDGEWDEEKDKINFYCNGCSMIIGGGSFDMRGCTKLPFNIKRDGKWLVISSFDGKTATVRLEDIFEYRTLISKETFEAWLADKDSYRQFH